MAVVAAPPSGAPTVLAEIRDAFAAALFSLGLDANTTSQTDIDAAADRLIEFKAIIQGFDSEAYLDDLAGGTLVVAQAYSSDFLQAREANPNLEFVLPEAGGLRWVDSLVIPAGAPHKGTAEGFIEFYLQPDVSAAVSNAVQVDTGNAAAADLLDASVRDNPVILPPADVLCRLTFTADLGDDETLYEDAWGRVQSA